MTAIANWIKDKIGNIIVPYSKVECIFNDDGTTLKDTLEKKIDKENPNCTGSFSLNRKDDSVIGNKSFVEGYDGTASGEYSHAEGFRSIASGLISHAEGEGTTASGDKSHAEGASTKASGFCSHSECANTEASGECSHAEGQFTVARRQYSHAEGYETIANGYCQHVQGRYNVADETSAFMIGNGDSDEKRSNALSVDWDGNLKTAGDIKSENGSSLNKIGEALGNVSFSIDGIVLTITDGTNTWNLTAN